MEWVTKQARLILPYSMILTRLFDFIIDENPELQNEYYVLYDRVMNPLAAQLEQKPRKDRGTRRGRHFTSSSTFNEPSLSHLNDDDDDGNNEGTSHASTPSPIQISLLDFLAFKFMNDKVAVGEYRRVKVLKFFDCPGLRQGVEDLRELLPKESMEYMIKKHVWFEVELQGAQEDRKAGVFRNMGFNESSEYKKTFISSGVGTGSVQVLQRVEFEVEPQEDHTFEVEPYGNVDHVAVSCKVISKWKAELKDDMDARSDVYVLSNGCKKCSDDNDATKGLLDKAKGNVLGMEIVKNQSSSLSGDCDVENNGKWSCIYAVRSQEYQMVCMILDIASANVGMLDKFNRKLQIDVQVFVDFDYATGRSIIIVGIGIGALVKGGSLSEVPTQVEVVAYCWKHGKSIKAIDEVLCFFWISSGPLILLETGGIANLTLQGKGSSRCTVFQTVRVTGVLAKLVPVVAHAAWVKGKKEVAVLMLLTMDLEIQQNIAHLGAYDMHQELKAIFVQNYNMHGMGKTVNELYAMLKLHEETLPKKDANLALHAIRAGRTPPPLKKDNPAKDAICHQCGCGTYICITIRGLRGSKKLKRGALSLYVGDGHRAAVEAIGTYHLELPSGLVIVLNNCHYAPSITRGVILVSRLFDDGFINRFNDNNVILVSKNNLVYFMAVPRDGIFEINMSCSNTNDSLMYAITNKRAKINLDFSLLWHCRLGHISKKRIEKLQQDGLLISIDIKLLGQCVSCMSRKMARKPYSHQVERAKNLLGLIHTDVCGPFKIVSRQGASYFVTFTDDFSRYGYVYQLKHKHEVFETFKIFQKEVENQLEKTIKSLRFDRGGEYMSQEFLDHLKEHRIIAYRTPPYTPQNNKVSERRNQTLLDMVRSMMSQTTLLKSFWDYALETAARILNMVPTKKDTQRKQYDILSTTHLSWNAEFFESKLLDLKATGSVEDLELIQEEDTNPSVDTSLNNEEDDQEIEEPQSDINPIRKSSRTRHAPDHMCLYIDAEEHELGDLGEPANYKAALLDLESKKWLDAMNVEMQSMKDNDVWVFVELPPNARTIAKGFTQTYGVDYKETFSPVADIRAIRILLAIVAYYDYEIWKMDIKTAFLNGHLSEEVYMEQPKGFVNPKYPNHVCKLKRSIYGLNISMLQDVKSYIRRSFSMKDITDAAYILGIKIYGDRSKQLIGLCQKAYIEKILKRYYMENSKRGMIPMQEKLKLSAVDWKSTKQSIFAISSTDVEYIAAFDASKEAVWIQKFIFGLGIVPTI
uniref:Integrase catalytic domain-containing protein n=1 Tax=Tanacetum cinerariifolium TaxID=118510 RepID=A0A699GTL8_TANCI|nr:hypothetical protein [Tanacetum cinerariifolium]